MVFQPYDGPRVTVDPNRSAKDNFLVLLNRVSKMRLTGHNVGWQAPTLNPQGYHPGASLITVYPKHSDLFRGQAQLLYRRLMVAEIVRRSGASTHFMIPDITDTTAIRHDVADRFGLLASDITLRLDDYQITVSATRQSLVYLGDVALTYEATDPRFENLFDQSLLAGFAYADQAAVFLNQ